MVSSTSELLLLAKAVAVAVWAPDMVLPSPTLPGVSGLLCSFVAIVTSLCSSLVTGRCNPVLKTLQSAHAFALAALQSLTQPLVTVPRVDWLLFRRSVGHYVGWVVTTLTLSAVNMVPSFISRSTSLSMQLASYLYNAVRASRRTILFPSSLTPLCLPHPPRHVDALADQPAWPKPTQ